MPYKLKKNAPEFDCVDGPFAGNKYRHYEVYGAVPPGDKARFEEIRYPAKAGTSSKSAAPAAKKKDASDAEKPSAAPKKGGSDK